MASGSLSAENSQKSAELRRLTRGIYNSKESRFYKDLWGNVSFLNGELNFSSLPATSAKDIIKPKFNDRIYIKKGLFVKIVYSDNIPFLLARTKADISREDYGEIRYERPLVFFESSHESIEKGLWLYSKNTLPLVAEDNLDITLMAAGRYGIDSVVGDALSLKKMFMGGSQYFDHKKIKNVTVIDSRFEENLSNFLTSAFAGAKLQLILASPETGPLAKLCKENTSKQSVFHPVDNTIIEVCGDDKLVATRLILLPTPIIRYETGIKIKMCDKNCSCENGLSFSLQN